MGSDDIIRESLIARIEQLTGRVTELENDLKRARSMIGRLSVPVNNLISLGDEHHKRQCNALLAEAREFRT